MMQVENKKKIKKVVNNVFAKIDGKIDAELKHINKNMVKILLLMLAVIGGFIAFELQAIIYILAEIGYCL